MNIFEILRFSWRMKFRFGSHRWLLRLHSHLLPPSSGMETTHRIVVCDGSDSTAVAAKVEVYIATSIDNIMKYCQHNSDKTSVLQFPQI